MLFLVYTSTKIICWWYVVCYDVRKKNHCCCCMYVVYYVSCWLLLYTSWYQTAAARLFTSELDWHQLPCLTHINGWFKFITFQCWAAAAVAVHSTECQSSHHPRSTLETSSLPFLMLLTTRLSSVLSSKAGLSWACELRGFIIIVLYMIDRTENGNYHHTSWEQQQQPMLSLSWELWTELRASPSGAHYTGSNTYGLICAC